MMAVPRTIIFHVLCIFCLCLSVAHSWQLERKVHKCSVSSLYVLSAHGEEGTVHALIAADTQVRPPALLLIYSPEFSSTVNVNCTGFDNVSNTEGFRNSVHVEGHKASYGMLFYQACVYHDNTDSAQVRPDVNCHTYLGSNLAWSVSTDQNTVSNPTSLSVYLRGVKQAGTEDDFLSDGSIQLNFTMYAQDSPPIFGWNYLIRGGFHIQIDLALDRLDIKNQGNRVVPSIFIFSNQSMDDHDDFLLQDMKITTPLGSLKSTYFLLDKRNHQPSGSRTMDRTMPGFALLPPVSSVVEPQVAQTKETLRYATPGPRINLTHKGTAKKYAHSLAYAFYGDRFNQEHTGRDTGHVGVRKQFINVGSPGDRFYTATNYIMWSMVLGLGDLDIKPSGNSVSSAAVAVPIVLILTAAAGGCWYWRRNRASRTPNVFRFEQMDREPSARLVPISEQLPEGLNVGSRTEPVEPFMARKLRFLSRHRFGRRNGQSSNPQTQPLLNNPPPAYESVVQQQSRP